MKSHVKKKKKVCNETMSIATSNKLLLAHFLGEMARKYHVEAASSPGMLPSPPSGPAHDHHGHRPIWGIIAIVIFIVLLGALICYLFRRKLLPALRKKSPWKVKGECTIFVREHYVLVRMLLRNLFHVGNLKPK